MSYDPNWFYSSLAQCAAAVVGLLGAVLATRLQEQYSAVRTSYEEVAKQLRQLQQEFRNRIAEITSFSAFADKRIEEIETAIKQGTTKITVNQEVYFLGGSSSGSDRALDVNKEILDNYKRLRSLVEPTGTVLQQQANLSKAQDLQHIEPAIARIPILPPDQHAVLNALIENWRNIIRSIERQMKSMCGPR